MDIRIKNYLGYVLLVLLVVVTLSIISFAKSYSRSIEPSSFRSFSVSGEGKVVAIPDIARFTFSVLTEGGLDISSLQSGNVDKMNKIIDFLKSNGVKKEDIKTEAFNLTPRYQRFDCTRPLGGGAVVCPPPEIVGYSINQTVTVKVRELSDAGKLLSGAVDNGANTVSQLTFEVDDKEAVEQEARRKAIEQAKEKARDTAKAGGFSLGKLLKLDEAIQRPFARVTFDSAAVGVAGAVAEASLEPGSQDIVVNVVMEFEIK